MSFQISTNKVLIWDNMLNKMVPKTSVEVSIVGNKGSVYAVEGPLLCQTGTEILEAVEVLKSHIFNRLPGVSGTQQDSYDTII